MKRTCEAGPGRAFDDATDVYVNRYKKNLLKAASVRIVDVPGANHHVFLSNEADVLRETGSFLTSLR